MGRLGLRDRYRTGDGDGVITFLDRMHLFRSNHLITRKEFRHMSEQVDAIKTETAVLVTKVDALLAFAAGQSTQITALQAQIASLPLSPADAAALQQVLADMQGEVAKVTDVVP